MPEISTLRIQKLSQRSDYPILAKIFLDGAMYWEKGILPYKSIRTCTYRLNYPRLVGTIDETLKQALFSALGSQDNQDVPEEIALRKALQNYTETKIAKRTFPFVIGGENDEKR